MAKDLANKLVKISDPSSAESLRTTHEQSGDASSLDRRKLRATGRTAQFNQTITPKEKKLFASLAAKAGMKHNVLLGQMISEWGKRNTIPEKERNADRSKAMTIYGNDNTFQALRYIARTTRRSISGVIESLVAARYETLMAAYHGPTRRPEVARLAKVRVRGRGI